METAKRIRRTNKELESDLFGAISFLVQTVGFGKITFVNVSNRARVEMSVLTRRYGKIENLIEEYTKKFDYFLNDILFSPDLSPQTPPEELFRQVTHRFVNTLHKNKEMQKLMIWELEDDNAITRKSARRREKTLLDALPLYTRPIKNGGPNPNAALAVLTAGMYYIILRKDRSTLCGIDFHSKAGRLLLIETLIQMVSMLIEKNNALPQDPESV